MYDKTVRRRRAVLGLLVASSLILLTAYFGESAGGGLHAIQRGVLDVVSPVQEGASRVLKPVRDLFGWAGDTLDAKAELKGARRERDALRQQLVQTQAKLRESAQLKDQELLNQVHDLSDNAPVRARVIGKDPNLWFDQVTIDQGTTAGVRRNQAVVNGQGLVGRVTFVTASTAIVTLITNHTTKIGGTVSESGVEGLVGVEQGHPTDLVLDSLSGKDQLSAGQIVVTSGTTSNVGLYPSPYPRDIPIGRVTSVQDPGTDDQQAHLTPFADLRRLDLVEVLTKPDVRSR
ncbi:MAG TPA: rod shape-determining protein MreC [Solirubrobacteraceae bacterium]